MSHDHIDDFLTQPWFIILLGSVLAIMMLSFGAMVFVKRKHMLIKQTSSLHSIRDPRRNGMLKITTLQRNASNFWLDPDTIIWRQTMPKEHTSIPDYAPVCTEGGDQHDGNNNPIRNRFDYGEFPGDYAEVSTFRKAPSECSGNRSPAPYATTTLVNQNQLSTQFSSIGSRGRHFRPPNPDLILEQQQNYPYHNHNNQPLYNRSIHSDSYFNPMERYYQNNAHYHQRNANANHCATFNPGGHNHQNSAQQKNRFKISRLPNFRISFGDNVNATNGVVTGDSKSDGLNDLGDEKRGENQFYVKIGEANPDGTINWTQKPNLYENGLHQSQEQQQQEQNNYHYPQFDQKFAQPTSKTCDIVYGTTQAPSSSASTSGSSTSTTVSGAQNRSLFNNFGQRRSSGGSDKAPPENV